LDAFSGVLLFFVQEPFFGIAFFPRNLLLHFKTGRDFASARAGIAFFFRTHPEDFLFLPQLFFFPAFSPMNLLSPSLRPEERVFLSCGDDSICAFADLSTFVLFYSFLFRPS